MAVELNRSWRILQGVKDGLGGHGPKIIFVEFARKIGLPADERLKEFDLVGCLIRSAIAEFRRAVGGEEKKRCARVMRFHDAGKEVPDGCSRSGDDGGGKEGSFADSQRVKTEPPFVVMDVNLGAGVFGGS